MDINSGGKFVMVFATDRGDYCTYVVGISKKDENGKFESWYPTIKFRKGQAPSFKDRGRIKIKSGFLTFRTYEDKKYPEIVCLDYEEEKAGSKEETEEPTPVINDDDLPF